MKKITVIGGGNMGFTYAESIFNSTLKVDIEILEKSEEKVQEILKSKTISAGVYADVLKTTDVIFLAVKPQVAPFVFEDIKDLLNPNQVVISIMAGVTVETIQKGLGLPKVVRAMPNLPAQVKLGMTTFTADKSVSDTELELVKSILATTGAVVLVENEAEIDKSTAVSGSGPGFVFYMMNSMEKKALEFGFSPAEAKILVAQTFEGSVKLYKENQISLVEWMDRVSSKGGTTIAGLNSFEDSGVGENIQNGMQVCLDRAIELGKEK